MLFQISVQLNLLDFGHRVDGLSRNLAHLKTLYEVEDEVMLLMYFTVASWVLDGHWLCGDGIGGVGQSDLTLWPFVVMCQLTSQVGRL